MALLNTVLLIRILVLLMTLLSCVVPLHHQNSFSLSDILLNGLASHHSHGRSTKVEQRRKSSSGHAWQKPGCHQLGHKRLVRIPGCVLFHVNTNACRGYCPSLTVPTNLTEARVTRKFLTSKSQCCSITKTHNVKVRVRCQDGEGKMRYRQFTFKSAAQCSCSTCAVT